MHTIPDKDFDTYNTRKLRQLETDLAVAQQRQQAAQAVSASLAARSASAQQSAAAAQANAAAAATNLAAAQATSQTVAQGVPFAVEAQAQAVQIVGRLEPVLERAHTTALLMIDALAKIGDLSAQVQRRKGKNELISSIVVSGAAQTQADAATALAAITAALQNTMLAFAAAEEASTASDKVIRFSQRLCKLLAPSHQHFDPARPMEGSVFEPGIDPLESIRDLAVAVETQDLSILAVLEALAQITKLSAAEQQAASTQAASELNAANDRLNRATAATQSSTAALAAAEAAVA
jgi:hypothetical protein